MVMNDKTKQMMQFLASQNICDGILYEPRLYWTVLSPTAATPLAVSDPEVFRNGEDFPVRITHVLAAIRKTSDSDDDRLVQNYGLLLRKNDTYYMNTIHAALPLWHNTRAAAGDIVMASTATWKFWKPLIMGARDVFEASAQLEFAVGAEDGSRRVSISFNGVGLLSRRPKQITSYIDFESANGTSVVSFDSDDLKNDGVEPLEIHEAVINVAGESNISPAGDILVARLQCRLRGNGTNAEWVQGPTTVAGITTSNGPAVFFGPSVSRAVIHTVPTGTDGHPGWLWYPGMGVTAELKYLYGEEQSIYIGLLGHVIVK